MLYLHIPFCKQACSYCNFHFSTASRGRTELLAAMENEIRLRALEIQRAGTETVYLGGGTPSLLTPAELSSLFATIESVIPGGFQSSKENEIELGAAIPATREITLEANPDDLTEQAVKNLADSPVNRLSIGLQSFQEADLKYMNRAHNATESVLAMERVLAAGFTDLSVDLIYGSPTTSDEHWDENISRVLDFGVPHVSAYALTVEPKTALAHQIKKGISPAPTDERFARQFDRLVERLTQAGYEHYEISNFSLPGHRSKHNTGYWQGKPYVGIGPSAHGYDGKQRRSWNVANNPIYTKLLTAAEAIPTGLSTEEILSVADSYNEFIMTGLRTSWGVKIADLTQRFGHDFATYFQSSLADEDLLGYFDSQKLKTAQHYVLNGKGKRLADGIAATAFWVVD